MLSLFTFGWGDHGLQNFKKIQANTYVIFGADPNDQIIKDAASLKNSIAKDLVREQLLKDQHAHLPTTLASKQENPFLLGVEDHLLSKTDHIALFRNLCDFYHTFVDFQFRNSIKPVLPSKFRKRSRDRGQDKRSDKEGSKGNLSYRETESVMQREASIDVSEIIIGNITDQN